MQSSSGRLLEPLKVDNFQDAALKQHHLKLKYFNGMNIFKDQYFCHILLIREIETVPFNHQNQRCV